MWSCGGVLLPRQGRAALEGRVYTYACIMLLCAVWCAALTHDLTDKRNDISPVPFVMGSRYGRSPSPARPLSPRNDRFFLGSRYGKRGGAGILMTSHEVGCTGMTSLQCEYTGVYPLYRCTRAITTTREHGNSMEVAVERPERDDRY